MPSSLTVTVPFAAEALVTDSLSASISEAPLRTSILLNASSSFVVRLKSLATGASFTGVTVMVSVNVVCSPLAVSVTVKRKLSVPL